MSYGSTKATDMNLTGPMDKAMKALKFDLGLRNEDVLYRSWWHLGLSKGTNVGKHRVCEFGFFKDISKVHSIVTTLLILYCSQMKNILKTSMYNHKLSIVSFVFFFHLDSSSLVAHMVKNLPAMQEEDSGSIPESGSSLGEGNGYPLSYSCLGNSTDRAAWWATVHGTAESGMTEWLTFRC